MTKELEALDVVKYGGLGYTPEEYNIALATVEDELKRLYEIEDKVKLGCYTLSHSLFIIKSWDIIISKPVESALCIQYIQDNISNHNMRNYEQYCLTANYEDKKKLDNDEFDLINLTIGNLI